MADIRHLSWPLGLLLVGAGAIASPTPGILVSDGLSMWAGSRIDSPGGKAVVATNSTDNLAIQMGGSAVIDGDVYCGPGGDPEQVVARWASSEVTGELAALEEALDIPPIEPPQNPPRSDGALQLVSDQTETISSDRRFSRLSLYGESILTIDGDVTIHVDHSIDMSGLAEIRLEDGASLALYVGGNVGVHQEARINDGGDVGSAAIFLIGTNRKIELTTDSRLTASVRSEDGVLRVWNTAEFTGSFFGRLVETGSAARLRLQTDSSGSIGADGLLAHYRFDESSGQVARDAIGEHNAALRKMKGDEWTAGRLEGALAFDGRDDTAVVADASSFLDGLDELTLSVWVKADRIGHNRGVFTTAEPRGTDDVLALRYDRSGWAGGGYHLIKAALRTDQGYVQIESASDVQTTDWQHLALVWRSGEQLRLYIDGEETEITAQHPRSGPLDGVIAGVDSLIIGEGVKNENWAGALDDLRFYNRALEPAELSSLAESEAQKLRFFNWAEVSPID